MQEIIVLHRNGLQGRKAISPGHRPGYRDMGKLALKGQKLYLASLCFCPCRASFLRNTSTQGDALGYELMALQAVSRNCRPNRKRK